MAREEHDLDDRFDFRRPQEREIARLTKANAELREALMNLAFAVAPDPNGDEPAWGDMDIEPHFQEPLQIAYRAIANSSEGE